MLTYPSTLFDGGNDNEAKRTHLIARDELMKIVGKIYFLPS